MATITLLPYGCQDVISMHLWHLIGNLFLNDFLSFTVIFVSKLLTTGGSGGVLEAADKHVVVKEYSNATLKCSGMSSQFCFNGPDLTWRYRNKSIESNAKYTVRERKWKCPSSDRKEVDFFLEISNVTEADSGVYQCQMYCQLMGTLSDSIQVTSYFEPGKMLSKLFQLCFFSWVR